jgi:hypothetical protein
MSAQLPDLLQQAEDDRWEPRAGGLVISRPAWWVWQVDPLADLTRLYDEVAQHRADLLPDWQFAAMLGLGRTQSDPTAAASILAVLALLGFEADPVFNDLLDGTRRAREVAKQLDALDPVSQLPLAREQLEQVGQLRSQETVDELVRFLG